MLTVTILFICQIKSSLHVLLLPNGLLCDLAVVVEIPLARIVVDYAEYVGLSILIFLTQIESDDLSSRTSINNSKTST